MVGSARKWPSVSLSSRLGVRLARAIRGLEVAESRRFRLRERADQACDEPTRHVLDREFVPEVDRGREGERPGIYWIVPSGDEFSAAVNRPMNAALEKRRSVLGMTASVQVGVFVISVTCLAVGGCSGEADGGLPAGRILVTTPRNASTPTESGRDILHDALQGVSVVLDTELIRDREQ